MSRWTDRFNKHAFQASWKSLKENLARAKLNDETAITSVEELGRLRKALSYIDGLLGSIDPELIPLSVLDSSNEQASNCNAEIAAFNSYADIAHVRNANGNVDTLLSLIRPYMVASGRTAKALRQAAQAYSDSMIEFAASFKGAAEELLKEASADKAAVVAAKTKALENESRLQEAILEFLGNGADRIGTIAELKTQAVDFSEKRKQVLEFYEQLLIGSEAETSIKSKVEVALSAAEESKKKADGLIITSATSVRKLDEFESKIFGPADEAGERKGGVSAKIDAQVARMDAFEGQQKTRYETLNGQIESLLPGATSAGLATAYKEMKDSFDKPIRNSSRLFYWSIGFIVLFSVVLAIDHIGTNGLTIFHLSDWNSVLRSFAYKAPIYLPLLWLAYYASKRRSECQRLQQEYAHKEALAKSYNSYRKQIEDLGETDNVLLKHLMQSAIDAIAYNASRTLDGKHGDKMPMQEVVEKGLDKGVNVSLTG
jgi:hypothetical protein